MEISPEHEREMVAAGFDPAARELMCKAIALLRRVTYHPKRVLSVYAQHHTVYQFNGTIVLRVTCDVLDSTRQRAGPIYVTHQHEMPLFLFEDEERALRHIRGILHKVELHEADEWFQVDGKAPFYPH